MLITITVNSRENETLSKQPENRIEEGEKLTPPTAPKRKAEADANAPIVTCEGRVAAVHEHECPTCAAADAVGLILAPGTTPAVNELARLGMEDLEDVLIVMAKLQEHRRDGHVQQSHRGNEETH